jgi:hypothetical protein
MASISPICKKCKKFYFSPQVPYLYRLHDKNIIKIQDIKISHLGTFKMLSCTSEGCRKLACSDLYLCACSFWYSIRLRIVSSTYMRSFLHLSCCTHAQLYTKCLVVRMRSFIFVLRSSKHNFFIVTYSMHSQLYFVLVSTHAQLYICALQFSQLNIFCFVVRMINFLFVHSIIQVYCAALYLCMRSSINVSCSMQAKLYNCVW